MDGDDIRITHEQRTRASHFLFAQMSPCSDFYNTHTNESLYPTLIHMEDVVAVVYIFEIKNKFLPSFRTLAATSIFPPIVHVDV